MLPDRETDAAREGTCAAWVAEVVINGDASCAEDMIGKTHSNGWMVDEDMAMHVQNYIDIASDRKDVTAEVFRKHEVAGFPTLQGTLDRESYSLDGSIYYIDDLKYGYDVVEPFENRQLICYAFLAFWRGVTSDRVELSIYQPRAIHKEGPYRTWSVTRAELAPYFADLANRIEQIASGIANAGSWCSHCLRAASCDALTRSVYSMWEPVSSRDIVKPTGVQLADELVMLDRMSSLLKARKAAVEMEAEVRIDAGQLVPGWNMSDNYGKSAWNCEPETIRMLTGVDPYVKKTVTPAELKRRGADKGVVASLTHRPRIGRKLKQVDERDIKRMFDT